MVLIHKAPVTGAVRREYHAQHCPQASDFNGHHSKQPNYRKPQAPAPPPKNNVSNLSTDNNINNSNNSTFNNENNTAPPPPPTTTATATTTTTTTVTSNETKNNGKRILVVQKRITIRRMVRIPIATTITISHKYQ